MFSSLKNGCSFCFHFWAVSMVFLADFPGSYAIHYNRAANFTARTTKKIPKLQKKFSEVPAKISRGSMKSFGLCHEIISPVILKSFGLSQDLPLSQNGQNLRRENWAIGQRGLMGPMGLMRPMGLLRQLNPLGLMGDGPGLKDLEGLAGPLGLFVLLRLSEKKQRVHFCTL